MSQLSNLSCNDLYKQLNVLMRYSLTGYCCSLTYQQVP